MMIVSCISFDSYIKPQRVKVTLRVCFVVYLLIPTSNHNYNNVDDDDCKLYIL